MGNRSKFVAVTAAGAVGLTALRARRRARLEHAAEGIVDAIMPSVLDNVPSKPAPIADEAHAPGHQHLQRTPAIEDEPSVPHLRERPWTKHAHGLRHPGRG